MLEISATLAFVISNSRNRTRKTMRDVVRVKVPLVLLYVPWRWLEAERATRFIKARRTATLYALNAADDDKALSRCPGEGRWLASWTDIAPKRHCSIGPYGLFHIVPTPRIPIEIAHDDLGGTDHDNHVSLSWISPARTVDEIGNKTFSTRDARHDDAWWHRIYVRNVIVNTVDGESSSNSLGRNGLKHSDSPERRNCSRVLVLRNMAMVDQLIGCPIVSVSLTATVSQYKQPEYGGYGSRPAECMPIDVIIGG